MGGPQNRDWPDKKESGRKESIMLEWLKGILGDAYTDEVDGKISGEIGKAFVSKTDFNTIKSELKIARETIVERDDQLETLKESTGDVATLQKQIAELQTANAQKDESHAAEISKMRLDTAVDKALSDAKAKNATAAKALMAAFLKDAKAEEDGSVRGLADEIKRLSEDQTTSFMFDSKSIENNGGMAGAAPAGNGGGAGGSGNGGGGSAGTLSDAINAALFGEK